MQSESSVTVVFDLGGVLIEWDPRVVFRQLFPSEEKVNWFLETVCSSEWNARHDAGKPFAENAEELVSEWPEYETEIRAYKDRWHEMVVGPIPDSVDILKSLDSRGVPLYALTNWSAETFPYTDRYDFMQIFLDVVVSGRVGLIKPDPAIYALMLDRFGLTPTATLFVDDRPENVDTAVSLGMDGIVFHSPSQLQTELSSRGLLT